MCQQLKDRQEQTEIKIESHKPLHKRVGDIEQRQEQIDSRVRDTDQRLSVTQEQTNSKVGDIEQRLSVMKEQVDSISKEQTKFKEANDAEEDINELPHIAIKFSKGKLF